MLTRAAVDLPNIPGLKWRRVMLYVGGQWATGVTNTKRDNIYMLTDNFAKNTLEKCSQCPGKTPIFNW